MKIKEIHHNATVAWGTAATERGRETLLVTGTAAGAMDSSFSSESALTFYSLNLEEGGYEMKSRASISANSRFQKLAWSTFGNGVVAGGMENGELDFWKVSSLLEGSDAQSSLIHRADKHKGLVRGLEFNHFQDNLLASGGAEGDIYIWDLNNPTKPYTPGNKSPKLSDISAISWNKQVPHILASSSSNGCTVIWDLKNKREAMSLINPTKKQICTALAWNPDMPTQIITASEDDQDPSLLVWDVRNARAPERVFSAGHSRGVLSLSWSLFDSGLLLSSGKDNRILCWKPQTGELLGELPYAGNWVFDVQWCPRVPNLISACSFDERVSLYSLAPTCSLPSAPAPSSDPFATSNAPEFVLQSAPKWMRRPATASFGFGGKLVTAVSPKQGSTHHLIRLKKVTTNGDLIKSSTSFEEILTDQRYHEFCYGKLAKSATNEEKEFWSFVNILLGPEPREEIIKYFGYSAEEVNEKLAALKVTEKAQKPEKGLERKQSTTSASELFSGQDSQGSIEFPETPSEAEAEFSPEVSSPQGPFSIFPEETEELDNLITQAIVTSNFKAAVDLCFHANKPAEALLIASCGGPELFLATQKRFLRDHQSPAMRLASALINKDLDDVILNADLAGWRHILTFISSAAPVEQFEPLCETLGRRLLQAGNLNGALLAFLCAADLTKVVEILSAGHDLGNDLSLHEFIEKITLLKTAFQATHAIDLGALSAPFAKYSETLANQGLLDAAMRYISLSTGDFKTAPKEIAVVADRIFHSGSITFNGLPTPPFPFDLEGPSAYVSSAPVQKQPQSSAYSSYSQQQPAQTYGYQGYATQPSYQQPTLYTPSQPSYSQPTPSYPSSSSSSSSTATSFSASSGTFAAPQATFSQPSTSSWTPPQSGYTNFPSPPTISSPPTSSSSSSSQADPSSSKAPEKPTNWNDPPMVMPKQKSSTPASHAPIYAPVASSNPQPLAPPSSSSPSFPPPSGAFPSSTQQRPTSSAPPPISAGPPKDGFQRQQQGAPVASLLPNPSLIPQPTIPSFSSPSSSSPSPSPHHQPPSGGFIPQANAFAPQADGFGAAQPAQPAQQMQYQLPPAQYSAQPVQPKQQPQPQPQQPPKKKAPSGDRSKIPNEHRPIFNSLSATLARVEKGVSSNQKKLFEDTKKRLELLFERLNEKEVPDNVIPGLFKFVGALESGNLDAALQVQAEILALGGGGEGFSSCVVGLKGLATLVKSVH